MAMGNEMEDMIVAAMPKIVKLDEGTSK